MWREPETGVPSGLIIGHHAVVDEPHDAYATLGIALLPASEFKLDNNGCWLPALGTGTGLLALLALELSYVLSSDGNCSMLSVVIRLADLTEGANGAARGGGMPRRWLR